MNNGIYQAIANAMSEIEPIAKGQRNKEQGFQYRGIDDVMNSLAPILAKNKIFIYPEVTNIQRHERQTKSGSTLLYSVLTVKYHFAHEDGSELCCVVIGEGMDSGDKASNKAMAIAYKYACIQMFCIPTADIDDPDATTPPCSVPKNSALNPPKNEQNLSKNTQNKSTEGARIDKAGVEIGAILHAKNPDGLTYFNEKEIEIERSVFAKSNISEMEKQYQRLKSELEKRKAAYKPIPFGDEKQDEFEDDLPWNKNVPAKEQDIF